MDLQTWIANNPVASEMLWKGSAENQLKFMRDTIGELLWEVKENPEVKVISTHRSKSISLPVYQFTMNGIIFILRDNFYNWKVSVVSQQDINVDFGKLFDPSIEIHSCYCEGFPEEFVFGSYNKSKKMFTIDLRDQYQVYLFVWLVRQFITRG